jgi:hypothetical protein
VAEPPETDPWSGARERARQDVTAALARREWTCATCGAINPADRAACATCGTPRVARAKRFERGPRPWLIGAGAVLALAALAAVLVPALREDAGSQRDADAREQAKLVAAERERQVRDSVPKRRAGPTARRDEDPLAYRARLVAFTETAITRDARARVRAGTADGPIRGTSCAPYPKNVQARLAAEDDPRLRVGRYQCTAFRRRFPVQPLNGKARVGLIGEPFWAVLQYGTGQVTFCKIIPRAGEGGQVLVTVPVPVPCRDPEGPG